MVTENGDFRYPPPSAGDDNDIPSRRRIARPPPLALRAGSPPASRPLNHTPSVYPPNSARLPPRSPTLRPIYSPQDELFMPPGSSQFGPSTESFKIGPPLSPTTVPEQNLKSRSRDGELDRPAHRKAPPRVPGLRISMSMSRLNSRQPNGYYSQDRRQNEIGPLGLGPVRASLDCHAVDTLRSSVNSAMTSRSSIEQASGTERSSVLTKASSFTDLSPDTPDGPYDYDDGEGGMSVEDAISMYLDGFSDVPEEPATPDPEEEANTQQESKELPTGNEDDYEDEDEDEDEDEEEEEEDDNDNHHEHVSEELCLDLQSSHLSDPLEPLEPLEPSEQANDAPPPHTPPDVTSPAKTPRTCQRESRIILPGVVPPPFLRGTGARDRYGFRKATHHVTLDQYEAWSRPYSHFAAHRKAKWVELLQENGLPTVNPAIFPQKSSRVKRFVRKGVPSEFRGAAWFWYAGGYDLMKQNPGHFEQLVRNAMESPNDDDKEHIERDLHRTFPDNLHFKPDSVDKTESARASSGNDNPGRGSVIVETQMIQSLRRVLYAFALHNPKVGYTQSLNFIAGLLLLFLPEENAFWMLHIVTSQYLPGTHEISLEGANIDLWILMVLLRESFPNIYAKIASTAPRQARGKPAALTVNSRLPDITLGLTNWLMSLFIGSLPLETTLRVWDVLFYEGSKTFFRVSLAIFKACEKEILDVSDPMEVFQVIQTVPKKLLDANALMEECFARKLRVGQSRIEDLRASRRAAVRQEKMRRSLAGKRGPLQEALEERPTTRMRSPLPGLDRKVADSWRHMKHHAFG